MSMRLASPETAIRLLHLAGQSYRPPEILRLKEDIEAKTRVAELRASVGIINPMDVAEIVQMKLELDGLYILWAEGQL